MDEEFVMSESLFWDEDESWAFPILACDQQNVEGKALIEGGKIVTNEEAPPPVVKGRRKKSATAKASTSKNEGNGSGGGGGGGGDSDEHELHIWTERERRKKMRNMFSNLQDLLPKLHPRADKSTIVDEAISYIKTLHLVLEDLENTKRERLEGVSVTNVCDPSTVTQPRLANVIPSREAFLAEHGSTSAVTLASPIFSGPQFPPVFKTWTTPNLTINVCGGDAHISICCPKKLGFLTAVSFVMERYKLDVVSAQVSTDRGVRMYMIHARFNGGANQCLGAFFSVEEIFKTAAAEILLWLNS